MVIGGIDHEISVLNTTCLSFIHLSSLPMHYGARSHSVQCMYVVITIINILAITINHQVYHPTPNFSNIELTIKLNVNHS